MDVRIGHGDAKKLRDLGLGKPDATVLGAELDFGLAVVGLVENQFAVLQYCHDFLFEGEDKRSGCCTKRGARRNDASLALFPDARKAVQSPERRKASDRVDALPGNV